MVQPTNTGWQTILGRGKGQKKKEKKGLNYTKEKDKSMI